MKKLITTLTFLAISVVIFAQGSVNGKLIDEETGETLIGASVVVKGTDKGVTTDYDGKFTLPEVNAGEQVLVITYTGFATKEIAINATSDMDLGDINMSTDVIGLEQVNVIASIAIDRKTPVAVSTIKGDVIEAKVGNQEFTEIFRGTPSVYTTKSGGGFGDGRINIRGFDQRNTAVMINGIPVNDMENGWVYWSNWAGLSDVTRSTQIQRGLGASKLAINSVGGTINIITKTTDQKRGGSVFSSVGNNGYLKYGATLSTGRTDGGWAFTFSGSRTTGDGYVDANYIDAWSYFGSISKEIGKDHQLVFTAIGAPQRHGQRSFREDLDVYVPGTTADISNDDYEKLIKDSKAGDFDDENTKGSIRYNSDWGYRDGEEFNIRENFYHKPQFALNHYWTISDKAFLATSAYYSVGRGGGTGDRGAINGRGTWGFRDANGLIRIDDIVSWNQGTNNLEGFPEVGHAKSGSGFVASEARDDNVNKGLIKRASMNEHNWLGVLSTANVDLTDNLKLMGGLDLRHYRGLHYRKVVDLMGNDSWIESRDVNAAAAGLEIDTDGNGIIDKREKGKLVGADDGLFGNPGQANKINYDNDGIVNWQGVFGQLEWTNDQLTVFGSGSLSNTSYQREDRFNYLAGSENELSETYNFIGYNFKTGANYNIDNTNNVFINTGYYSRAPNFDVVFPNFNNVDVNPDAASEKVLGLELGYGLRTKLVEANLNLYYTNWIDKTFDQRFFDATTGNQFFTSIRGIDAVHQGVELEIFTNLAKGLTLDGMVSLGDWKWKNNVDANIIDDNNEVVGNVKVFADDLKVGDAAQTTFRLGLGYDFDFGLGIDMDVYYFDNLYTNFDVNRRTNEATAGTQALQLPSYSLVDAGISYRTMVNKIGLTFRLNVNNMLDELYVAEANDAEFLRDANGFFGFGRTWNAGVKIKF